MSPRSTKDRKKPANPGSDTDDPFEILGVDRSIDLSNPLVKGNKTKASKKARLATD
ncbi:MAG TPA: hypothetical protein VFA17_00315 [Thermoplasmata archaeon]|nr:hypothetical protein [Thermoplasmata archaeon]